MNDFEKVANDVIVAIDALEYEDKSKKLIQSEILLNLYQMFRSKEKFEESIELLKINERCSEHNKRVLRNKLGQ